MGDLEEAAGQIRAAPFPHAGVLIEGPERVPVFGPDIVAGKMADGHAVLHRLRAFLLEVLALARGEGGEEAVEVAVSFILPVELLVLTTEEAEFTAAHPFLLGAESDVEG